MLPRIITKPIVGPEKCVFTLSHENIEINFSKNEKDKVVRLLSALDGRKTLTQLVDDYANDISFDIEDMISELHKHHIVEDCSLPEGRTGIDALLELEELANELLYKTLHDNVFWRAYQAAQRKEDMPLNVMRGLVIEKYHFLFRESYFDAPVLSYVGNTKVRLAMNEFFAKEYGQDELLLKSLNAIGITRAELSLTLPLPQTMAMCNALAYWAHNDPLFFFTTLGLLERKDIKQDSFIDAINLKSGQGSLTREIFSAIPIIDLATIQRLRAQTYLFVELYDDFYAGIWNHYASATKLIRHLNDI